jgi:cyclic pyranopterin phosphate synthase
MKMENGLTHFDNDGKAVMVDVSQKEITARRAEATGSIRVNRQVMDAILQGTVKKGDVLGVARIAGIMAVKKTQELIPLCHTLPLDGCSIDFHCRKEDLTVDAVCSAWNHGRTGVEMEALTGVSMALLTIYDMCKAIDKRMVISDIHLLKKTGGKSGDFCF